MSTRKHTLEGIASAVSGSVGLLESLLACPGLGPVGHTGKGELSYSDMAMLTGLAVALQTAAQPNPKAELQTTFFFLILAVCALGFFLWFIMSRFSRLP